MGMMRSAVLQGRGPHHFSQCQLGCVVPTAHICSPLASFVQRHAIQVRTISVDCERLDGSNPLPPLSPTVSCDWPRMETTVSPLPASSGCRSPVPSSGAPARAGVQPFRGPHDNDTDYRYTVTVARADPKDGFGASVSSASVDSLGPSTIPPALGFLSQESVESSYFCTHLPRAHPDGDLAVRPYPASADQLLSFEPPLENVGCFSLTDVGYQPAPFPASTLYPTLEKLWKGQSVYANPIDDDASAPPWCPPGYSHPTSPASAGLSVRSLALTVCNIIPQQHEGLTDRSSRTDVGATPVSFPASTLHPTLDKLWNEQVVCASPSDDGATQHFRTTPPDGDPVVRLSPASAGLSVRSLALTVHNTILQQHEGLTNRSSRTDVSATPVSFPASTLHPTLDKLWNEQVVCASPSDDDASRLLPTCPMDYHSPASTFHPTIKRRPSNDQVNSIACFNGVGGLLANHSIADDCALVMCNFSHRIEQLSNETDFHRAGPPGLARVEVAKVARRARGA
jgi:hypothetical protein